MVNIRKKTHIKEAESCRKRRRKATAAVRSGFKKVWILKKQLKGKVQGFRSPLWSYPLLLARNTRCSLPELESNERVS